MIEYDKIHKYLNKIIDTLKVATSVYHDDSKLYVDSLTKYQNKINGHVYIGKSIDIEQRQYNHKYSIKHENANDYNSQFHQAVRKYNGLENFDYEVIAELTPEEYTPKLLNELSAFLTVSFDVIEDTRAPSTYRAIPPSGFTTREYVCHAL